MTQDEAQKLTGYTFTPGWRFHEIKRFGKLSGFVMSRDNEIHVYRLPEFEGRWFVRGDIERVINPLLKTFESVVTKVRKSNSTGRRFCERIGFVSVGTDGENIIMKLERLNHARH